MNLVSPESRRHLQTHHAQAATEIDNLKLELGATALDPALLTLCSAYFETALRGEAWSPPESLTELESACLHVCEQFMASVSGMREDQIAMLSRHLPADDVYNLMYAIYIIESSKRLDLALGRLL